MSPHDANLTVELAFAMLRERGLEAHSVEGRVSATEPTYAPRLMPAGMVVERAFDIATMAVERARQIKEGTNQDG